MGFNLIPGKEASFLQQMVNLHETADGKKKSLCWLFRAHVSRHHVEQLETTCEDEEGSQVSFRGRHRRSLTPVLSVACEN